MTNFGTAEIRNDSLSLAQHQNQPQDATVHNSIPSSVLYPSLLQSQSNKLQLSARVPDETARHILKEASGKRSEPFPEEIAQAIHRYSQARNVSDARQDVIEIVTPATPLTPRAPQALATSSHIAPLPLPSSSSSPKPNTKKRVSVSGSLSKRTARSPTPRLSPPLSDPLIMATRSALLITSLGNPPPYHSTRHSAAHLVLKCLQSNLSLPPFTLKSKLYGGGHISHGSDVSRPEFTLWQSPSLMNVSGPPLLKAWKQFVATQKVNVLTEVVGLVVLHDEMETEPGKLTVRRGGTTSAKGHNGIKSVQASLNGAGMMQNLGDAFVKIGIGIGRPAGGSRESRDVSAFVLGQLTSREKEGLENAASELEGVLYNELARLAKL